LGNLNKALLVLAAIILVSSSNFLVPDAEAKDFVINSECVDGNWVTTITDKDGNPLTNVQVGTIKKLSSTSIEDIFYTDENGIVIINSNYLTGFVKISKGGYNVMKIVIESCVKPPEFSLNGQNFQKQKTDLYIVKHWSFAGDYFIEGYGNVQSAIVGEIVNLSDTPITDILINVKTFRNGQVEEISSWYPIKKILRPGEASPFAIRPALVGFDSYEIWIRDYEFTNTLPNIPSLDVSELILDLGANKWDTYTIQCSDLEGKAASGSGGSSLSFLFIWYNEQQNIDSIGFEVVDLPDKDDCRRGQGTFDFVYSDIPLDNSFEFFF